MSLIKYKVNKGIVVVVAIVTELKMKLTFY